MFPQSGWRIGRIGEIEIKINPSLLIVAALVTVSVARVMMAYRMTAVNPVFYWIAGIVASVLFVASILWHELAHSIVAIRYHIPVVQIVLHLFGGVAQIARDPERPSQEFWIAIAGPISSLVLSLSFGLISVMAFNMTKPFGAIVGGMFSWLAVVNFMLAAFNLLPGFPLDGGRILRAGMWRYHGSYRKATRQASRIGQAMAILFALSGGIQIIRGELFNGLWLLMIAVFLYSAASTTFRMAKGGSLPMDTPVRRIMRFNVPIIEPTTPLAFLAWKYLDHARDQAFPVMQNGQLLGMVTVAEINKISRLDWGKYRVEQVMLPRERLCVINPDDHLQTAFEALEAAGMDHAPVLDVSGLVGMLNRRDIVYRT
jgi:Zn-dependent protease/predicted transcriptional regulator